VTHFSEGFHYLVASQETQSAVELTNSGYAITVNGWFKEM